jgi:hypothetical protein
MNEIELTRLVKPLDIGFTSGRNNPWTIANRASGAGWKHAFDRRYTTHTFLFTIDSGLPFATELTPQGIEEDSASKYLNDGKSGKLIAIYRYKHWDVTGEARALARLAHLRQIKKPYSWLEAIGKNQAIRKIFPRLTARNNDRETCDENVFTIHKDYTFWQNFPDVWAADSRTLHPYKLRREMVVQPRNFELIWRE